MVNITVSIPEELYRKMKKYSEVRWSEVVRKALADYIRRLEAAERGVVPSEKLLELLGESSLDLSGISLEKALEFYEKARELEWKRFSSTTQARS
ncbi:MAG: ribbon-helix-helix domain-containing protein [Candidatus Bathyarchaeia archaeon]